jgi:hypothetical protein
MRLLVSTLLLLSMPACVSHDRYVISRSELDGLVEQNAKGAPPPVISAVREQDGKAVRVRTAALLLDSVSVPATQAQGATKGPEAVAITARAKNRMVTAGSVLTWIGTGISLIGTALFIAGKVTGNDPIYYAGAFTTISAEPFMWTGTGLWLRGAIHPPYELPP